MRVSHYLPSNFSRGEVFDTIETVVVKSSKVALAIMFLLISINAITRRLFAYPIRNSLAITELYLMPMVVVLAFSFVRKQEGNVRVDLLSRNFSERTNVLRDVITDIAVAAILLIVVREYANFAVELTQRGTTSTGGLPTYVSHWIVVLGLLMLTIRLLIMAYRNVVTLR